MALGRRDPRAQETHMLLFVVTAITVAAIGPVCRMVLGLYALRDVPPSKRAEILRALRS